MADLDLRQPVSSLINSHRPRCCSVLLGAAPEAGAECGVEEYMNPAILG